MTLPDSPLLTAKYANLAGDIKRMNIKVVSLALAGLVTGAALAVLWLQPVQPTSGPVGQAASPSEATTGPVSAATTGKALVGGPFTLTDHTGQRVTDKDFLGRYLLVFFGFTNCPDICPSGLQVMSAALDKLGPTADAVTPIFITVDPERDTVEKLAAYVKSFHPRLVGLTGSSDEIAAAIKTYRVYAQKVEDDKTPGAYSYDHAALFYVMGKNGQFIAPIPHSTDVNEVASALTKALK